MVLQVSNANNVKIYTVSGGLGSRSIPDWLARQKKKTLKKDLGTLSLSPMLKPVDGTSTNYYSTPSFLDNYRIQTKNRADSGL